MIPTVHPGACPRCRRAATITSRHPVCARCQEALRREAAAQQEHAYLAAWLSSRVDAKGQPIDTALCVHPAERRTVARLVRATRRLRLDWTRPQAPVTFDARLATLLAPYTGARRAGDGRELAAQVEQQCLDLRDGAA